MLLPVLRSGEDQNCSPAATGEPGILAAATVGRRRHRIESGRPPTDSGPAAAQDRWLPAPLSTPAPVLEPPVEYDSMGYPRIDAELRRRTRGTDRDVGQLIRRRSGTIAQSPYASTRSLRHIRKTLDTVETSSWVRMISKAGRTVCGWCGWPRNHAVDDSVVHQHGSEVETSAMISCARLDRRPAPRDGPRIRPAHRKLAESNDSGGQVDAEFGRTRTDVPIHRPGSPGSAIPVSPSARRERSSSPSGAAHAARARSTNW